MASEDYQELPPARPEYVIEGWDDADNAFFVNIGINDARFSIYVSPENFHRSPSGIKNFNKYMEMISTDNSGETENLWDYLDWITAPFLPAFRNIAPTVEYVGKLTLAHLFNRRYFDCRFDVIDETPLAGPITPVIRDAEQTFEDSLYSFKSSFPTFNLSDVEVLYNDPFHVFDVIPQKVFVQNQPLFWKSSYSFNLSKEEIDKYNKISASDLTPEELRTSRLYGVVLSTKGYIYGLLFHLIEVEQTLTWAVDKRTPRTLREKWASQIRNTLSALHSLGVIWGDVKAGNVLIDKDENAIIIDLEGGSTRGWVDKDKAGTIEGDLQGLENLMDYIFNDNSVLRPNCEAGEQFIDDLKDM